MSLIHEEHLGKGVSQHLDNSEEQLKACMTPLLDALGWRGSQLQLHEALPRTSTSMNLGSFLNTMANMNFESHVNRMAPCDLNDEVLPCLILNDEGRAAVLLKRTDKGHLAYDGRTKQYHEEAFGHKRETIVRFLPMKKEKTNPLQRQPFWFLNLSLRFHRLYLLGIFVSILLSILALASPMFIMAVYSQLQVAGASPPLVMIGLGILIYIGSDLAFRFLRAQLFLHLSDRISYLLSTQVLRRVLLMPPSLTEASSTQSQLARIREFENISSFFSGPAIHGLLDLFTSFLLMGAMIWIGGQLVWIPAIAVLIAIIFGLVIRSTISKATSVSVKSEGKKQELLFDMVHYYRDIKTAGITMPLLQEYQNANSEAALNQLDVTKVHTLISSFSQALNQCAGIATMVFGVHLVLVGQLPSASLLACMLITWKILSPIRNLFTVISQVDKTLKSIQQLNRFMNLPQESQPEVNTNLLQTLHGDIVFSGVSMKSATDQQPSIVNINFRLPRHSILFICGHAGVDGQSVLDALMRLRDYQSGNISIDDVNIRQFDPITLRKSLALVPAKTQLFRISLLDNLYLAQPTATQKDIDRVIKLARIDRDLQALPDGLHTMVDGRPQQFSESFMKRFGFARAWLRNAPVHLYHLPDKGLTKSRILDFGSTVNELKITHTAIIVSNNPDLFRIADVALWLEDGKIKLAGRPEDVAHRFYNAS